MKWKLFAGKWSFFFFFDILNWYFHRLFPLFCGEMLLIHTFSVILTWFLILARKWYRKRHSNRYSFLCFQFVWNRNELYFENFLVFGEILFWIVRCFHAFFGLLQIACRQHFYRKMLRNRNDRYNSHPWRSLESHFLQMLFFA